MFEGNWTCSSCGGAITQLPFEPRSNTGLTCRDCFMKQKNNTTSQNAAPASDSGDDAAPYDPTEGTIASEPAPPPPDDEGVPTTPGERKMFAGDWQCSGCSNPITQLPFEPRSTENLKCLDCFKKSKG